MELDIIAFGLGCIFGAVVGYRVADAMHKAIMPDLFRRTGVTPEKLEQVMRDLQKEVGEEVKDPEILIKVEQHGEQLYVFRKDNDEFLGQGRSYDEILKILQSKFKNVKFAVHKEDGAELLGLVKDNPTS
jgi:hypothetical protein